MKLITIEQLQAGVVKYIEQEVASKAVGIQKFMAYFIIPSVPGKVLELINRYRAIASLYMDENGNIKIEEAYKAAREAMEKTLQFEAFGLTFNAADVDALYKYIREQ